MVSKTLLAWAEAQLGGRGDESGEFYPRLRQLTIVIPSFDRPDYVLRQMVYWAHRGPKIIIVDGSEQKIGDGVLDLLSTAPNICYIASRDSYVNRVKQACDLVTTPYAMCLADDDLLLMEGLNQTIERLEDTPDTFACMGQIIGVDYEEARRLAYVFPYGSSLQGYEVRDEDAISRIRFALGRYRSATAYAIYRASAFKEVWLGIDATHCLQATEYEHAIATYIEGRFSTVPFVYWLRSFEAGPVDSVPDGTSKSRYFAAWWRGEKYATEQMAFVDRLARRLELRTGMEQRNAGEAITEAVGLILSDGHVGLVNNGRRLAMLFFTLGWLYRVRIAGRWLKQLKGTRWGKKATGTILMTLRGAAGGRETAGTNSGGGQTFRELEDVLSLIKGFHIARDAVHTELAPGS